MHPCGLRSGLFLTDPRSLGLLDRRAGTKDQGSVAGQMQSIPQPALILPTFAGVGPVRIYSFVSAINPQMRLSIKYNA